MVSGHVQAFHPYWVDFLCLVWNGGSVSLFCMRISSFPSIHLRHCLFPIVYSWHLYQKLVDRIHAFIYGLSILFSWSMCLFLDNTTAWYCLILFLIILLRIRNNRIRNQVIELEVEIYFYRIRNQIIEIRKCDTSSFAVLFQDCSGSLLIPYKI